MAYTVSDEELERRRRLAEELAQRQQNYGTYQESDYVKGLRDKATSLGEQLDNYSPFSFTRQADYDKAYGDYMNRKKFTWDADSDALYNLYKDKYMRGGQMAMQDAMGQAAALSGGYGNSYAATVGNQAYQNYLTGLNDVVPQLYQLALDRYNAEGNDLKAKIGLLQGERDTEYGQYNDAYNRLANSYTRNYGLYGDERGREQSDFDTAYARLVDSYNIANTDFRNAVSDQQAAAQLAASRRSSGGSGTPAADTTFLQEVEKAKNSEMVKLFNASIMTKREFARRGGTKQYGSYSNYVEQVLEKWRKNIPGRNYKLTDAESAAIIARYGL